MQAWRPLAVQDVSPADFEPAIQALQNFDMFLLGTGSATDRPPAKVMQHLNERNVPVEIMTTSSAVHVYNVVLAEGRRVAAALIVVV